jgi:hypothetical protein
VHHSYKFFLMDEMEIDKFSWSGLFFVTCVCSFFFSLVLKILDGQFPVWLLVIGAITGALGAMSLAVGAIDRQYAKKRKGKRFAS